MITVQQAQEQDKDAWEAFQLQHSDHHAWAWAWRAVLQRAFGHTPQYLIARDNQANIVGVLPLFHVKSALFGSALISVPYLNGGGILAEDTEAFLSLLKFGDELAEQLGARYVELRHRAPLSPVPSTLVERSHKVSMLLPLEARGEEIFASFPPKLRSQIRRPRKSGIDAKLSDAGLSVEESLDAFFQVFSEHMRDLGTPVFPRALFAETKRHFGAQCRIITVWHDRKPVSAGITVRQGRYAEIPWAASLRRYNQHSPNMLLYWEAIKSASEEGCDLFDFGRSSYDSGPYRFKQQWKPKELPLYWYYRLHKGELPDVSPANPKYATMVRCWQKLPLSVANTLGPWITRSLP